MQAAEWLSCQPRAFKGNCAHVQTGISPPSIAQMNKRTNGQGVGKTSFSNWELVGCCDAQLLSQQEARSHGTPLERTSALHFKNDGYRCESSREEGSLMSTSRAAGLSLAVAARVHQTTALGLMPCVCCAPFLVWSGRTACICEHAPAGSQLMQQI